MLKKFEAKSLEARFGKCVYVEAVSIARELLLEAGFRKATIYWEGEDEDGEGNGEFTPEEKGEADLAWIAYIVAEK